MKIIATVDFKSSKYYDLNDLVEILNAVEKTCGLNNYNKIIIKQK
jgi:hypothetical protein